MKIRKQALKRKLSVMVLAGSLLTMGSCSLSDNADRYAIIPQPNQLKKMSGEFVMGDKTRIVVCLGADSSMTNVVVDFAAQLRLISGLPFVVSSEDQTKADNSFVFTSMPGMESEAYNLKISKRGVLVEASTQAGFFYAIQTIKQMLPVAIYSSVIDEQTKWTLPCVEIADAPRFGYRGLLLDVCRHFWQVDEVKRVIDVMATHKLNTLHWHLTDDQGWRIESKKFPRLIEIGSMRNKTMIKKEWGTYDNIPYGGYYTQDQIREIVAYAAARSIRIIPEVDLPGHMVAALASYPELGCTGGPYEVSGQWGVLDDVLCVGKEKTFEFLEGVMSEVIELFPSEYIHIGGDECPKVRWEKCPKCQARIKEQGLKGDSLYTAEHALQSYTMNRIEKYLNEHGRRVIGWDEILEGGTTTNATVMSWRGMDGGIKAASQGQDVIMSPMSHAYIDYYQSLDTQNEPFGIGGYVSVERVYSLEPVPDVLTPEQAKHIIGAQTNLWCEYIATPEHLEYMLLPRLAAISEVQWTQAENKNIDRFLDNMLHMSNIYNTMGVNYAKHIFGIMASYVVNPAKACVEATLHTQGNAPIYYTIDGSEPTDKSMLYAAPIELTQSCTLRAVVQREGMEAAPLVKEFIFNKATGKPVVLNTLPNDKYKYSGATILTDGIRGDFSYSTGCWLGYLEQPLDVVIDLGIPTDVSSVSLSVMEQKIEWLFPPRKLTVWTSDADVGFEKRGELEIPVAEANSKDDIKAFTCSFDQVTAQKIRIVAETTNQIPDWHSAHGERGFLFVDEIIVD